MSVLTKAGERVLYAAGVPGYVAWRRKLEHKRRARRKAQRNARRENRT